MNVHVRVGNKKRGDVGEYIGRPSALGNPFVIGKDGNRAEVVEKYRVWLSERIIKGDARVLREIVRLRRLAERPEGVSLLCWCSPLSCHGEVVKEVIETQSKDFFQKKANYGSQKTSA